jgi:hypothetical protein
VTLRDSEPARVLTAAPLEDVGHRARRVPGVPAAHFDAFLDGTQQSHVACYVSGMPVVVGTVGAVVRRRDDRRLHTWKHAIDHRVYFPADALPAVRDLLSSEEMPFTDTSLDASRSPAGATQSGSADHPFEHLRRAFHCVQQQRSSLERRLAEQWCTTETSPLYVDGAIDGSPIVASSAHAIGVIKSHRTIYADGAALPVIQSLAAGERTGLVLITSPRRSRVASFYLRLRDASARDPFFGLVRAELAESTATTERADEVSRWILAEAAPLSLPDHRWDTMAYGIRDCEEFLRAVR